jgi:hypothetical protein
MIRRTIASKFLSIVGISCVAPFLYAQTKRAESPKPIETTVCDIVADSQRFDGRQVRFFARFQSDGLEHSALVDSKCSRGIIPFTADGVENHSDIEAFDRALEQGQRGTMDKRIVATFTGRFVRRTSRSSRTLFVLEIERIDDLQVTMIDLKPHVPR